MRSSLGGLGTDVVVVAVLLVVLAAVVIVLRERAHRRRLRDLLERLSELERMWGEGGAAAEPGTLVEEESVRRSVPRGPLSSLITSFRRKMGPQLPVPTRLDYRAVKCIYERLEDSVTASAVAGELHVSLRTLQRGLSDSLGCSPSELIIGVKMHEAKRRLLQGRDQVQEVARAVGYEDPFHFSRRFKAYYGSAPSLVRDPARDRRTDLGG